MAFTYDGKYVNLATFKQHGQVHVSTEDDVLASHLQWAESTFERYCACQFNAATETNERPAAYSVTADGWLRLFPARRAPVTAVTSIQYRVLADGSPWKSLSWVADDLILPTSDAPPGPDGWGVLVNANNAFLYATSMDHLLVRWTYTAGYATTPEALEEAIEHLAWWKYKLREAPLGKVVNPMMGTIDIPLAMPEDVKAELYLWQKKLG